MATASASYIVHAGSNNITGILEYNRAIVAVTWAIPTVKMPAVKTDFLLLIHSFYTHLMPVIFKIRRTTLF